MWEIILNTVFNINIIYSFIYHLHSYMAIITEIDLDIVCYLLDKVDA